MTHRWLLVALCSSLLLVSSGCGATIEPTHQRPPFPTIGPIVDRGRSSQVDIDFITSTNCAEVGETIIFTIQITNTASYPVTITGAPLLDIELHPAVAPIPDPIPVQRWSASDQYPRTIKPVLAPGEVRHYEWHWVADQRYVPKAAQDLGGVNVYFIQGTIYEPTGNGFGGGASQSYIGIGGMARPDPGSGWFQCADLPRR